MQKSTITLDGVDYIVRTIDITSLPTFGSEGYRNVDVADVALWNELERRMEQGDKYAMGLDETVFFYPDSEFIRRDPTDEELLDYLREHLCGMTKKYEVTCTRIYNGSLEVEAESADAALAIARERLDEVEFEYGETTADYAVEMSN